MISYILTLDEQLLYNIGFQLLSTVILCALLAWLLYKPVNNALNNRKKSIEDKINQANQNLAKADSLKFEYELKLSDIEKEKSSILETARKRAKENEAQIVADAKKEAEAIKNRAMLDIQREQEKAKDEIRKQIIEVSSLVANNFIKSNISEAEHNNLIDQAIKELEEIKWQN